jgi:1-acyl-sn-glycerol-3-phosphate acyltransferase
MLDRLRTSFATTGHAASEGRPGRVRAAAILVAFLALTLPLMPVQRLLLAASLRGARRLPHWYHRQLCRLLGVRLRIEGEMVRGHPVLVVANHTSWLDIPVISAVAPLSFIAKKEVSTWPLVASLARLQRSVFVDRTRRVSVGDTAGEIITRLREGDTLVLFAEGTSSDGNRVLPFRSSLFAAAKPSRAIGEAEPAAYVQTMAVVYSHLHGVPLGRGGRAQVGWYGEMAMASHVWDVLAAGPLDVRISIGPPIPLDRFADRKALARHSEAEVRSSVVRLLRGRA